MSDITSDLQKGFEKPCLVSAGQGFSVLYKNKTLYSRYNPQKLIIQTIQQLEILPDTLILCISPCLWYGLSDLYKRMPDGCMILGIEYDPDLYILAADTLKTISPSYDSKKTFLIDLKESRKLAFYLTHASSIMNCGTPFPSPGSFKRIRMIIMSGGYQFYKNEYDELVTQAEQIISSFWKNRLTLVKLGRLFSRNLFRNLGLLPGSSQIESRLHQITRPILVVGAGESAEQTLLFLSDQKILNSFYLLAVDAALPPLTAMGIKPQGIVAVESQYAIEQAYIGSSLNHADFFADITSRPQILRRIQGSVYFFSSAYTESSFYTKLKKDDLLPAAIPALGSVGLTAVYLAVLLRNSDIIPIYVTGMDFSFSAGTTHLKGAPAILQRLRIQNRLLPPTDYGSCYGKNTRSVTGKNGKKIYTNPALSGYASLFAATFSPIPHLYDAGSSGISIGIPETNYEVLKKVSSSPFPPNSLTDTVKRTRKTDTVHNFYKEEEKALKRIQELLISGKKVPTINDTPLTDDMIQSELSHLLSEREYLYLHFPDGYKCSVTNISFLKRVRAEISFFLKDIQRGLKEMADQE